MGRVVSDPTSVEVVAERLDNHLKECAQQNELVLSEIREMRAALQPVLDVYTTAKLGGKLLKGALQFIIYAGGAVAVIGGGLKAILMMKGSGA